MEREKTDLEFTYGDKSGCINVFLPRVDGLPNVTAPSPVFTLENIFRFSDQVMGDRQLFVNKKAFFTRYVKIEEAEEKEKPDAAATSEREELPPIKVVQLSFDASGNPSPKAKDKRFNERLNEHVAPQRRIKSSNEELQMDGEKILRHSILPESSRFLQRGSTFVNESSTLATPRQKTRRDLIFYNRRFGDRSKIGLEKIDTSRSLTRQGTSFTLNSQRSMWIPRRETSSVHVPRRDVSSVQLPRREMSGYEVRFEGALLPLRSSSRPTAVNSDDSEKKPITMSNISIQDFNNMSDTKVNGHYRIIRQKTSLSNIF